MQVLIRCYHDSKPTRAFTLIELLVVIAIITLLAALLFPTLGRARAQAKVTTCQSNLRQIHQALQLYCDQYNAALWETPSVFLGEDWPVLIGPYLGSGRSAVFVCPDNPWYEAYSTNWPPETGTKTRYRFSYPELNLSRQASGSPLSDGRTGEGDFSPGRPLTYALSSYHRAVVEAAAGKADSVLVEGIAKAYQRNPSEAILLGELRVPPHFVSGSVSPGMAAQTAKFVVTGHGSEALYPPLPPAGRLIHTHGGRSNWLFLDGHVRALTVRQTLTPKNLWTARSEDQPAFDVLARQLAPEYQ
ncbi:MAG TPA: prepilin-type N-terminal cleavage/methylation domain-containing protein [Armatimonadota bacterium]|jgi:prepilin-type processing-associated H-X9-DG protein/prepilin-type N-terminal cleavage/methylation domain-containing protein